MEQRNGYFASRRLLTQHSEDASPCAGTSGRYYDYYNPAHRDLINSLALHANFGDYAGWLFMPFAPVGSLFWFGSMSLINTLWYNGTRVTSM